MEAAMKIAVFGVGAMGCLFGARLSPHADVTLIGRWPEQLAALRAGPLRVVTPDGQTSEVQIAVTSADALEDSPLRGAGDAALATATEGGATDGPGRPGRPSPRGAGGSPRWRRSGAR